MKHQVVEVVLGAPGTIPPNVDAALRGARLVDTEKAEERSKRSAAVEVERSLRPSEAIDPVHAAKEARLEEDDADLKKALELSRLGKADLSDPDELEKALRASEEHDDALRGKPAPTPSPRGRLGLCLCSECHVPKRSHAKSFP